MEKGGKVHCCKYTKMRFIWGVVIILVLIPTAMLFLVTSVLLAGAPHVRVPAGYRIRDSKLPRTFAHRGSTWLFPQNTLFAFRNSVALGADVLDMDVRITKDGHVVLVHDPNLFEITGKNVKVSDSTLEQLQQLDFGFNWTLNGQTFPYRGIGIRVTKLEDLVKEFPKALLNIELKLPDPGYFGRGRRVGAEVCRILRVNKATDRAIVMSFSDLAWLNFRTTCPEVATASGPLGMLPAIILAAVGFHAPPSLFPYSAIQPPMELAFKSFVSLAHKADLAFHVWTVDDPSDISDLIEIGVDGIMSDRLDILLESMHSRGGMGVLSADLISRIGTGKACEQTADAHFARFVKAGCTASVQAESV